MIWELESFTLILNCILFSFCSSGCVDAGFSWWQKNYVFYELIYVVFWSWVIFVYLGWWMELWIFTNVVEKFLPVCFLIQVFGLSTFHRNGYWANLVYVVMSLIQCKIIFPIWIWYGTLFYILTKEKSKVFEIINSFIGIDGIGIFMFEICNNINSLHGVWDVVPATLVVICTQAVVASWE